MKLSDLRDVIRVRRPPAPYGVWRLARCYSVADLACRARRRLPRAALGYLEGGGADEYTLGRNRAAFDELELVPRVLRDVTRVDTATTVLGARIPLPIALAPVGAPALIHHRGELAAARAAHHAQLPFAISTFASTTLERVATQTESPLWLALYVWGDRSAARDLIARAEAAGYAALLVTVDVSVRSKRERELHSGVTLPVPNLSLSTVLDAALQPSWSWRFITGDRPAFPNVDIGGAGVESLFDGALCWDDVEWIRGAWRGPLALKGVLSPADAQRAADLGVDGIVVSNHGGRQLDHVPAAIDVLPDIVDAVGDRVDVLVDSGIRRGTDIVTALALGARAVLVGRAYLYGLAVAGEPGVAHAIDILASELRTAMALVGAARLADLDRGLVRRRAGGTVPPRREDATAAPAPSPGWHSSQRTELTGDLD